MKWITAVVFAALLAAHAAHAQISGTMTITGSGAGYYSWQNPVTGCTVGNPPTTLSCTNANGTPLATLNNSDLGVASTVTQTWTPATTSAPPALSNVAASASYAAGAMPTILSPGTTVSDSESPNLVSATVSITSGLLTGDTLAATTAGSIGVSYNASTGVLSLTGTDTLAHYQQVLDSVSYSSSNPNPSNTHADQSRMVSWAVNDGTAASAPQTTTVNITGGTVTTSLFSPTAKPANASEPDNNAVNLGVKFTSSVNGTISGIRFYKGSPNTGTHIGSLWSSSGTLLASATFTNETASGWQQVNFSSPVSITAGATYTASYHTNTGEYADDVNYFTSAHTNAPLTAPSNAGVYVYGSGNAFPTSVWNASNYWVDVVFNQTLSP